MNCNKKVLAKCLSFFIRHFLSNFTKFERKEFWKMYTVNLSQQYWSISTTKFIEYSINCKNLREKNIIQFNEKCYQNSARLRCLLQKEELQSAWNICEKTHEKHASEKYFPVFISVERLFYRAVTLKLNHELTKT